MAKNLKGKTRPTTDPYETLTDPRTGWVYKVLKHYASTERELVDPYARVFCEVQGFETEMGDTYVSDVYGLRTLLRRELDEGSTQ